MHELTCRRSYKPCGDVGAFVGEEGVAGPSHIVHGGSVFGSHLWVCSGEVFQGELLQCLWWRNQWGCCWIQYRHRIGCWDYGNLRSCIYRLLRHWPNCEETPCSCMYPIIYIYIDNPYPSHIPWYAYIYIHITANHACILISFLLFMTFNDSVILYMKVLLSLPIGFAVFMVHLATIPITGTGINPARSFGAAVIFNKDKAWNDHVRRATNACMDRRQLSLIISFPHQRTHTHRHIYRYTYIHTHMLDSHELP